MTEVIGETFSFVVLAILIATLIIFVPWLTIWAINTLVKEGGITGFHIPLNFWTWLAAFIINYYSWFGTAIQIVVYNLVFI